MFVLPIRKGKHFKKELLKNVLSKGIYVVSESKYVRMFFRKSGSNDQQSVLDSVGWKVHFR